LTSLPNESILYFLEEFSWKRTYLDAS